MTKYIVFLSEKNEEDLLSFTFFETQKGDRIKFHIVNYQGSFNLEKLKYVAIHETRNPQLIGEYYLDGIKVRYYEVKIEEWDEERKSIILETVSEIKSLTLSQIQREEKIRQLLN